MYQNFLHEVGRSWISQVQNTTKSNSDDLQLPERQTTPRGHTEATRQTPGILEYTNWRKYLMVGRGKKNYPARRCKVCASHKK
jgi:hypothetical protein